MLTRDDIRVLDPETYRDGDPTTFGLPLEQFRYLRDHEPVAYFEMDNPMYVPKLWVVSRHEDCLAVDRNPDLWAADIGPATIYMYQPIGEEVGAPAVVRQDGDRHRNGRRAMNSAFTPKLVARLEEQIRDFAVTLVDSAVEKGEIDFIDDIANPLPMRALGDLVGVPPEDRPKFFGWADRFAAAFDERITKDISEVFDAITGIHEYALELRDYKREHPGEDVMTRIAQSNLTDGEVKGNVTLLASGAAESTRNALAHGLWELMRTPEQMAWLRARQDNIPDTAIQEIVRIACPFTSFVRVAREDTELHGVRLPQGSHVLALFSAANFDERVFDEPDTFDLGRQKNPHLGFGKGPHACIGRHIASLEIKVLFEELLKRTSSIEPTGPIDYVKDNYSRGVYRLPVKLTPS